jgi:hypothetical protein
MYPVEGGGVNQVCGKKVRIVGGRLRRSVSPQAAITDRITDS